MIDLETKQWRHTKFAIYLIQRSLTEIAPTCVALLTLNSEEPDPEERRPQQIFETIPPNSIR